MLALTQTLTLTLTQAKHWYVGFLGPLGLDFIFFF